MISDQLKKRIKVIRASEKIPSVILVTGLYDVDTKTKKLTELATLLEGGVAAGAVVSESKGNLILLESENQSSIKVDDVRDLLKQISLKNWDFKGGRYILIPQADLLTVQSSNALLKSLEEAPEGSHFILGVPSKRNVLKTILSRSFVLNEDEQIASNIESNAFYNAFFKRDLSSFSKMVKADLKYEWQMFQTKAKDEYVDQVYSGDLDKNEWHKLFDFMEDLDVRIEANMDVKWLASAIERFSLESSIGKI